MVRFEYKKPREYYKKLVNAFGSPTGTGQSFASWENIRGYECIYIMDENIKHTYPKLHYDYVYSSKKMDKKISDEKKCQLVKVSGSIIIDGLKNEVTARCGGLTANDVTLNFVDDVIHNKTNATKEEYAKRINNSIIPNKKKYYAHNKIN